MLKDEFLPPSILKCKRLFQKIKPLELLAPEYLRQRTREAGGDLGRCGQNLSAFLYEIGEEKRSQLLSDLKQAYPKLQVIRAKPLRSGWKQIEIHEEYEGEDSSLFPEMTTEARHVNDGLLRVMAILAEPASTNSFLLFDEIENGINPELVGFIIGKLVNARQQVLVTTHSPIILNYLDDETAKAGVIYLYRNRQGHTKAIKFFSIPSLQEKLKVMGPGEVFVDTDLPELTDEIETATEAQ